MNLITSYKKAVLSATVIAAMSMNGQMIAACSPCAAAAAARKSVVEAAAAALAAGKSASHDMDLDLSDADKSTQDELAVAVAAAAKVAKRRELDLSDSSRAPREPLADECNTCDSCDECEAPCASEDCEYNAILNFIACQVQSQGRDARKCCKRIKHEIRDVEELVEFLVGQSTESSSTIDTQLSVLDALVVSQISQSDVCCAALQTQMTNLDLSVAEVLALLTQVFNCTCV